MTESLTPPRWFGPVVAAVTYGQAREEASECKDRWLEFFEDSVADNQTPASRTVETAASFLGHMWWRSTHGERTALPTGFLLALAAISTASLAVSPDGAVPARANIHVGLGLLAVAVTFLRFPRWQPGPPLAAAGVLLSSSMVHGLAEFSYVRAPDAAVVVGSVVMIAAAVPVVGFALRPTRREFRTWWLGMMSLGAALFSVGSLDLFHERQSLSSTAVSAAFVAATAALVTGSLYGLRKQQPELID